MKISELFEEAIPIVSINNLWSENGSNSAQYITNKIFQVKMTQTAGVKKYSIFQDNAGTRITIGVMTQDKLDKNYTPIRGNQKPDAEGFIMYRDSAEFEAFKYQGDTTKVELDDGSTVKLLKGDYILRQTEGDEFVYSVEASRFFDQNYTVKS